MLQQSVEICVETLCNQGCKAVWRHISALERGENIPETDGLAPQQIEQVLAELRIVMAVYKGSCKPD